MPFCARGYYDVRRGDGGDRLGRELHAGLPALRVREDPRAVGGPLPARLRARRGGDQQRSDSAWSRLGFQDVRIYTVEAS